MKSWWWLVLVQWQQKCMPLASRSATQVDCSAISQHWKVQSQVSSDIQVISDIEQCDGTPDYVIEVAGQAAVKEHAQKF